MKYLVLAGILALTTLSAYAQRVNPEPNAGWTALKSQAAANDTISKALDESGLVIAFYSATVTKKGALKELQLVDEGPLNAGSAEILTRMLKNTTWKPGTVNGKASTQIFLFSFAIERKSRKALAIDSLFKQKVEVFVMLLKQHGDTLEDGSPKFIDSVYNVPNPYKQTIEARYPGNDYGFIQHVSNSFNYPSRCLDENINGYVLLKFRVSPYGLTSQFEVLESTEACPEFADEAIRVLRLSERWIPAVWGSGYIQAYRKLPIALRID
jgi:hypothetical protein